MPKTFRTAVVLIGAICAGRSATLAHGSLPPVSAPVAPAGSAGEPEPIPPPHTTPPRPVVAPVATPPQDIQCGAARASSSGRLLAAERSAVQSPRHALRTAAHRAANVRRAALGLAAEEARNRDAGIALELYWSLAEAVHSRPLITESLAATDAAVVDRGTLAARGLEVPVDPATLDIRRLALADGLIAVDAAVDTLSIAVRQAAGLPPGPMIPVQPGFEGEWTSGPPDVERLVREGLASKPELRMLRMLLANLDAETLDVARTVLGQANPALGGKDCERCCRGHVKLLRHRQSDCEVAAVARQLRQLLGDREAAVEADVRRAARLGAAEAERAGNATHRLEVATRALADLRGKQTAGEGDAFAIHLAEVEVAKERRAVVERLAMWERHRVQVWAAQGVLAARCGLACH